MSWQDLLFGAGSLVFIAALIPMVRAPDKPPLTASVPTGAVMSVFCVCYLTLGLLFAAVTDAVTAALWWTLAAQRKELTWFH